MNYCQFRNLTIKRMANAGGGILPAGYQQVEYLESTGSQYVNTGVTPDKTDTVSIDFQLTNISSNNVVAYTEYPHSGQNDFGVAFTMFYSKLRYIFGWSTWHTETALNADTDRHVVTINNGLYTLDSTITRQYSGNVTVSIPLYLFATNTNGSVSRYGKARVYRLTIISSDNISRIDLYPCYRKSDDKPGMYDLVTNTFFTNAGTGEFTVGNNV